MGFSIHHFYQWLGWKCYTLISFLMTPVKKGRNTSDDTVGLQIDVSNLERWARSYTMKQSRARRKLLPWALNTNGTKLKLDNSVNWYWMWKGLESWPEVRAGCQHGPIFPKCCSNPKSSHLKGWLLSLLPGGSEVGWRSHLRRGSVWCPGLRSSVSSKLVLASWTAAKDRPNSNRGEPQSAQICPASRGT